MGYYNTVRLVTDILFFMLGALLLHFIFFAVAGLFARRTYPKTETKYKYGLIIPARNEESVVGALIESIRKNDYPQDKLHIFVIAHNCTDNTAEVARSYEGVSVYEYDNPEENTMGFAFRYLFDCIERDFGTQSYDGFFLFNADNVLDREYFTKMNDAFAFYDKKCVISSFRNSKNFGSNLLSGLYGMYFTVGCRLESRGRTAIGCSTRVQGTGYVVSSELVKNGWQYTSLAEDWEFTADQVILGNNIRFCDDAVFYDEQPTSFHIMWRQRLRWSRGHLLVFYSRFRDMLRTLFSKDTTNRFSVYDIAVYIMPAPLFFIVLQIVQFILLTTSPLFDPTVTLREVFLGTTLDPLLSTGMLFVWIRSWILSYVVTAISAVLMFIVERRRIKGVSFAKKVLISLSWPLFLAIQMPIDVEAFFARNLGWKPIPHNDRTTFEHVNEERKEPSIAEGE